MPAGRILATRCNAWVGDQQRMHEIQQTMRGKAARHSPQIRFESKDHRDQKYGCRCQLGTKCLHRAASPTMLRTAPATLLYIPDADSEDGREAIASAARVRAP